MASRSGYDSPTCQMTSSARCCSYGGREHFTCAVPDGKRGFFLVDVIGEPTQFLSLARQLSSLS